VPSLSTLVVSTYLILFSFRKRNKESILLSTVFLQPFMTGLPLSMSVATITLSGLYLSKISLKTGRLLKISSKEIGYKKVFYLSERR